jgi:hypothetical protein
MIKTNGHKITPTVKLSEPFSPNKFQLNGFHPKLSSSANIFTPINSANKALVTKNTPNINNKRAALLANGL